MISKSQVETEISEFPSAVCYAASGAISSYLNGYDSGNLTYGVTVTNQYNSRLLQL